MVIQDEYQDTNLAKGVSHIEEKALSGHLLRLPRMANSIVRVE